MKNDIHTVYRNNKGERVCSVTTFLGILNKPALMKWAFECGVNGQDYLKVRDFAASVGTLAHYLVDCKIKGIEPDLLEYSPDELATARPPIDKFNDWAKDKILEPILMEVPLVSETYQFGGKPDFYGKIDGVLTLLDYKTGLDIYREAFYQTAAYKKLLEEHGHQVDVVKILRLGKSEDEGFAEQEVKNLDKHFEVFLACQKIYLLQRDTGKNTQGFTK